MPLIPVTISYLEMTDPKDLRAKHLARPDVAVVRVNPPMPELNRFFYTAVGGDWFWIDRLPWTYQDWQAYLHRPGQETWILTVQGLPAGYFELRAHANQDAEIIYFGLLPRFVGKGLGGYLLSRAVERGWEIGGKRIWLHTCTLDYPQALANYRARGFRLYKEETQTQSIPEQPVGPWVGARKS